MSSTATDWPRRHKLTVAEYYRMGEVGILGPDERVELVEGEIIDVPPPGSRHAGTVDHLARLLERAVGDDAIVHVQNPVFLDQYSEPQPDLALLRPRPDFYKKAHPRPEDLLLAVEVAESTLRYDRDVKVPLYARHGVPEVWLVDLRSKRLTRYRDPGIGGYGRVDQPDLAAGLTIGDLARISVDLVGLWEE